MRINKRNPEWFYFRIHNSQVIIYVRDVMLMMLPAHYSVKEWKDKNCWKFLLHFIIFCLQIFQNLYTLLNLLARSLNSLVFKLIEATFLVCAHSEAFNIFICIYLMWLIGIDFLPCILQVILLEWVTYVLTREQNSAYFVDICVVKADV